jgi:hypothetical protein
MLEQSLENEILHNIYLFLSQIFAYSVNVEGEIMKDMNNFLMIQQLTRAYLYSIYIFQKKLLPTYSK